MLKVSKLIASLQELLDKFGDCNIAVRNTLDTLHTITGTGFTIAIENMPSVEIVAGERVLWLSTVDPKLMNKIYSTSANNDTVN